MTSYVTDGTVGPWAREKLECLGKYLHAYTTILRKQTWCESFVYLDAFAGAGKAQLRKYEKEQAEVGSLLSVSEYVGEEEAETETYVHGSPRVALSIQHPFSEYVFIEKSTKRLDELRGLQKEHGEQRNITLLEGDANEQINQYLLSGRYNWTKSRAVAFLDPFGMQVPWKTIEALGKTKAVEIILNLPVGMAIQRLLPKSGQFTDEQKQKLTAYFGSPDWESIAYEEKADLFGMFRTKRHDAGHELAKWYQKRLKEAYGHSSRPRLIKNTRGTPLYYLLWAGPNPTGARIAEDVLKQGEAV